MEEILVSFRVVNGQLAPVFKNVIPTAEQCDALIAALGRRRARIEPQVPDDLPPGLALEIPIEHDPKAEIAGQLDGSSVLMLRHSSFGWLGFRFPDSSRTWLIDGLIADEQTAQQKPTAQ
ncbi:hypothetical protein [Variovorax paradoxus]|uniref:hypothetical protein n=1 Tax=Variovorax paradoxus TaxID=34073 RepID=UPI001933C7FC|nr:hypothetical protein INQ48_20585 [Variovorax paradoxus]